MLPLNPKESAYLRSDIETWSKERTHMKQSTAPTASKEINPEKANFNRSSLKSLHGLIKNAYEEKQIVAADAEKMLRHVEERLITSAAEFYLNQAEGALKRKDFKTVLNLYQKAIDAYQKTKRQAQYKQEIIDIKAKIKSVQQQYFTNPKSRNAPYAVFQLMISPWAKNCEKNEKFFRKRRKMVPK